MANFEFWDRLATYGCVLGSAGAVAWCIHILPEFNLGWICAAILCGHAVLLEAVQRSR